LAVCFEDEIADFLKGRVVFEECQSYSEQRPLSSPGQDVFQELSLALGQGMIGRGDEQNQITPRNKFGCQPLVMRMMGVRAGCVNNVQLFQEW